MTPEFWLGLAGLGVTIGGWLLWHVIRDHETQSNLKARVDRIEQDIGTHDSGIRGELHKQRNMIGGLKAVMYFIGQKLGLTVMKSIDEEKSE